MNNPKNNESLKSRIYVDLAVKSLLKLYQNLTVFQNSAPTMQS